MRYDFHACTWLVNTRAKWRHLIWRHLVICVSQSDRAKVARGSRKLPGGPIPGVMSCFFPVFKCHYFALEWSFALLFFLKMCKKFSRFQISYREVAATSSSLLFWRFFDFLLGPKAVFSILLFSCPLFKFAVNGFNRTVFSEIQSEKIISNEPFSDEIFASAIKKREKFVKLYSSPASNVQLLVQVLYITRSARSSSLRCFLQIANWKKWRKMASN